MRLWELHTSTVGGAIRTTPHGEADIDGLVLSEKAYLLAVREYRPAQLVELVRRHGAAAAGRHLVTHFNGAAVLEAHGGRGLTAARAGSGGLALLRSDEAPATAGAGRSL